MSSSVERPRTTARLARPSGDPIRAWDASGVAAASAIVPIGTDLLRELELNRALLKLDVPPEGAKVDNTPFPVLRREGRKLLRASLDGGLGFAILRGLDPSLFSPAEIQNVFWRLCNVLGEPLVQKGDVKFGRVADLGLPAEARPRYHETGAAGSVHTDGPIMSQVADLVGLLCLRPALSGGESKFVSVARVHDILLEHAEGLLAELYESFYFDRRINPLEASAANPLVLRAPIFSVDPSLGARGLRLRWQAEYVWQAPELPGVPPLRERQKLALHVLEEILEDRDGAITLRLPMGPGDMQFLNNHSVAHGRTPFRDAPRTSEPASPNLRSQREMRRVWLRRRP